jgi:hypothetical protein
MDVVRALFVCGVIAGPLFVFVFLIEGAMTPDYDPQRHPVHPNGPSASELVLAGVRPVRRRRRSSGPGRRPTPTSLVLLPRSCHQHAGA